MGLLDRITSLFDDWHASPSLSAPSEPAINPANGLPMTGGIGGVDVLGNPFGTDLSAHRHDDWHSASYSASPGFHDSPSHWHDSGSWNSIGGGHDSWRD
ncbi:hypothetical protein [Sphingomonas phyllosphaerae]|uniref:hypothetical protein n=1 Tax=Sphingomonas phyllosphaerae TaxID=257003 RepID=UPI0024139271|nr:hypothetical protein [Sphingomonas phyllosphaerae]